MCVFGVSGVNPRNIAEVGRRGDEETSHDGPGWSTSHLGGVAQDWFDFWWFKNLGEKAMKKSSRRAGDVLGWGDASRVLPTLERGSEIVSRLREAGYPANRWGSRESLRVLVECCVKVEDAWEADNEYRKPCAGRRKLRKLRRGLENAVWP